MQIITLVLGVVGVTGSLVAAMPTSEARSSGLEWISHPMSPASGASEKRALVDLSGASCTSSCSGTAGQGPNETDCSILIEAAWAQGTEKIKPSVSPYNYRVSTHESCEIDIVNPTADGILYQYNLLGSVAEYLRTTCNAAHGWSQGQCVFDGHGGVSIQLRHA